MDQDDVIDTLNDLIENSKDGEYGFRACAEYLKNAQTQHLFLRRADECAQAAAQLQQLVVEAGGKPEDSGSVAGAVHRGWVAVRGSLSGYSDLQILEEAERGEDKALDRYRKALTVDLPASTRAVVESQMLGVQRNHQQVKALRDRERVATDA